MTRAVVVLLFATVLATVAGACSTPTDTGDVAAEQWTYQGSERVPAARQLEGTLRIARWSADRFEGSLDMVRTDALGVAERRAGLVSGRRSGDRMDFEVSIDGSVVRHVGRRTGDSVSGTWLDDTGYSANLSSGAFVMRRRP